MDKRLQALSNLINALMETHSDMVDIITSKSPTIFTEEERAKMLINELFLHQAIEDVKKEAKDILERGDNDGR